MHTEQWANINGKNVYLHQNRNAQNHNNQGILLNHQQYLMSRQPRHNDVFTGPVHYSFADTSDTGNSSDNPNNSNKNFSGNPYERIKPNINYSSPDINNGQAMNSKPFNDQYNMLNTNNFHLFNQDMEQYKQHYAMLYNTMKSVPSPPDMGDGVQYATEHLQSLPVPNNPHSSPTLSNVESLNGPSKSQLLDNFLGNWTSNPSGTYTPFGHTFLNVQPNVLLQKEGYNSDIASKHGCQSQDILSSIPERSESVKQSDLLKKKDSENISFSDVNGKKRIVAEVKPMRPSYSAVLSKTPKTNNYVETSKKKDTNKEFVKPNIKVCNSKQDKFKNIQNFNEKLSVDDKSKKNDIDKRNPSHSQSFSGSESGEINNDVFSKNKNKKNDNGGKKYISLDDLMKDEDDTQLLEEKPGYGNCDSEFVFVTQPDSNCDSEFVFVTNSDDKTSRKRNSKKGDMKNKSKHELFPGDNMPNKETLLDPSMENDRAKRKKDSNARKIFVQRNKKNSQGRNKRAKNGGFIGKMQNVLEHWMLVIKNILFWFYNLLSDIFRMSTQLSIDFASLSYKNTHSWLSDLCHSIKDKITSPQWLKDFVGYIDKKMGHTWVGFWRNMKFLKLLKHEDDKNTQKQNNINIPLPATGDEAMKRLLACKGKDPYSILGVGAQCSDEDIKRYYRRQAFLVHPDKNQQPGAEEAFKILQHAFDLIGEPARREAYDRKLVESAQMEAALSEVADLLVQLQDKVKHAAGTIRCTNCCRRHLRTITSRPAYAARYCHQCKIRHAAKEGDIWAESQLWGLVWKYYACMDGAVYQITQWASCQKKNLKHLVANTHHVQYRIVLGNNKTPPNTSSSTGTKQSFNNNSHDANLEDFLNNLYSKSGQSPEARNANSTNTTGDSNKNRRKTKKSKP